MKFIFTLLLYVNVFAAGCHSMKKSTADHPVNQGIKGFVTQVEGNRMPAPGEPATQGQALKTALYIYEKTHMGQVDRIGTSSFYTAIHTKKIAEVVSDASGAFAVSLPAGDYSVFALVNGKYYANSFDSRNFINPVTVFKDQVTELRITVSSG